MFPCKVCKFYLYCLVLYTHFSVVSSEYIENALYFSILLAEDHKNRYFNATLCILPYRTKDGCRKHNLIFSSTYVTLQSFRYLYIVILWHFIYLIVRKKRSFLRCFLKKENGKLHFNISIS